MRTENLSHLLEVQRFMRLCFDSLGLPPPLCHPAVWYQLHGGSRRFQAVFLRSVWACIVEPTKDPACTLESRLHVKANVFTEHTYAVGYTHTCIRTYIHMYMCLEYDFTYTIPLSIARCVCVCGVCLSACMLLMEYVCRHAVCIHMCMYVYAFVYGPGGC